MPSSSDGRPAQARVQRRARRRLFPVLLLPLALLTAAATSDGDANAARASADVVLVREGEVVAEDLYAGGNTVTIEGVIEGDLVVWAFDRLDIRGSVEGNVVGYATSASITGDVGGSVRLVGLDLRIGGSVGGDVLGIGWSAETDGDVARDVLVWANTLRVGGTVGRDVEGQTIGETALTGTVGRDFQMTVGGLFVGGETVITQDLIYQTGGDATIASTAVIGGTVTQRAATVPNVRLSAVRLVTVVLAVLAFVWIGLLMIWLMPETMRQATSAVRVGPFRSLVVGVVAFVLPVLLAASIVTLAVLSPPDLALTILGIGAPVWISLLVVLLLGVVLAPVPVAIAVGRRVLGERRSAFAGYLLGVVLFIALLFVPYVGLPAAGILMITGLGALARGAMRSRGSLRWTTGEVSDERRRLRRSRRLVEPDDLADEADQLSEDNGFLPRLAPVALDHLSVVPPVDNDDDPGDPTPSASEPGTAPPSGREADDGSDPPPDNDSV